VISRIRLALLALLLAGLAAGLITPLAGATSAHSRTFSPLLSSRELWATVDVCNPAHQRDTVGIRGAMPGDGQANDRMYMSFRLQYLNPVTGHWTNLLSSASASYVPVGGAASARQGGRSFQLVPPAAGKPAVTLRGVADFQWRRGKTIVEQAERTSTAGHKSLAGADPAGYSAASCVIS
jgi:hypothetical protein